MTISTTRGSPTGATLAEAVDRLDAVIDRARRTEVPYVLVHNDLYGDNMLVDDDGEVVAILDWDHASLGPREHDLWMPVDAERSTGLLATYGARDLNATHLEYALLARALRDLAARGHHEVDRPGIEEWGFRRLARPDEARPAALGGGRPSARCEESPICATKSACGSFDAERSGGPEQRPVPSFCRGRRGADGAVRCPWQDSGHDCLGAAC